MEMMMERTPAEVFSPGELIKDEMEARSWSQIELAEVLGRPGRLVSELIAGKRAITPETAKALGQAFGTGAQFWLNMESSYQLSKVKGDSSNAVARRAKLYEMAPVKEMTRRAWIQPTDNIDVLEKSVCSFYRKPYLDAPIPQLAYAARKSTSSEELTAPEAAWLCRVRQLAEGMEVKSFSEMDLASVFSQLKTMLRDTDTVRQVPAVLASAGVRFLIVEALPSTRIDGVCLWLKADSPVIALSLRYDRIDAFWHTLLHECAHLKYKDGLSGDVYLDIDLVGDEADSSAAKPEAELKADEFASGFSIPKSELDGFIARVRPLFSKTRIQAFAAKLNVHPGLVVGQLQYRKMIPYSHSREMLARIRPILTEVALTDGFGSILSNAH
jgi:HTH-type transcriptional regulator / antitoxin HigA